VRARWGAALVAVALLAGACSDDGGDDEATGEGDGTTTSVGEDDGATTTTAVPLPEPSVEERECAPERVDEVPAAVTYDCLWLTVPEHHDAFDGDVLRLAVTVLHTPAENPRPDPVVYLSGGPGGRGGNPNFWSTSPFIEERDIVVYDQRGTGESDPNMQCPEMEDAILTVFGANAPYAEESDLVARGIAACHDRLVDEGVDLTAFSTPESAADLADLRVALGYDEWNLLGVSYGTRLAQETLRSHPEGLRSVILDSTYPMSEGSVTETIEGAQRAIDQLAAGCAADAACTAAHGDLVAKFETIVEQYNAEPHRSTIDLGEELGGELDIVITGDDIVAGVFNAMYDTALIPLLPSFATALEQGESGLIDQVAVQGIPFLTGLSEGMAISTSCADSAPVREAFPDADADILADPEQWATIVTVFSSSFCALWGAGVVDDAFVEPVQSDLRVLVLSGTYDPVTTTPGAELVAEGLGNATLVTFDGLGHGTWDTTACGTAITLAYLADPSAMLDTACAADIGPPDFA
jgi:pimeloyl-ACP methyl ester carboxylesterase